jgi:hypothetical protein
MHCKSPHISNLVWTGFGCETYFVGRQDKLAKLNAYHCDKRIKVAVISGLGGMGKSKLAFHYAVSKKDSTNCVWLRGEDKDTLRSSLNSLAHTLHVNSINRNEHTQNIEALLTRIMSQINSSGHQPWLFILDNVDSEHELITQVLNSLSKDPNVFIVLTSVLRNIGSKRSTAVLMELTGFTDVDCEEFLKERLGFGNTHVIRKLCRNLQSMPLAMDQTVQYILDKRNVSLKGEDYGIEDFLAEYHQHNIATQILDYRLVENEKTMYTTVKMCIEKIKGLECGDGSVSLLHILCYFDPDGVPISFLEEIMLSFEGTVELLQTKLVILKKHSLIGVENGTIIIHRVVQKIVPLLEYPTAETFLGRVAHATFKTLSVPKSRDISKTERRQANVLWNHIKKLNNFPINIFNFPLVTKRYLQFRVRDGVFVTSGFLNGVFACIAAAFGDESDRLYLKRSFASNCIQELKHITAMELLQKQLLTLTVEVGQNHPIVIYLQSAIFAYRSVLKIHALRRSYVEERSTILEKLDQLPESDPYKRYIEANLSTFSNCLMISLINSIEHSEQDLISAEVLTFKHKLWYNSAVHDCTMKLKELECQRLREKNPVIINPLPNPWDESSVDWCKVNEKFPELFKLLDEAGLVLGINRNHDAKLESLANLQEMPQTALVNEIFLSTKRQMKEFFIHEPNFLIAVEILDDIQTCCFEL